MKAFTHTSRGNPLSVLHLSYNLPIPKITRPTDVLVKVSYASLDPGASMVTNIFPMTFRTKLSISETDFSGIVVATKNAVSPSRQLVPRAKVWGAVPILDMILHGRGVIAQLVAVCSGRNRELVMGLAADKVIDYQEHGPIWKYLGQKFLAGPFDAILDCRGVQELFAHCPRYLKKGKPFVTVGPSPPDYNFSRILYIISSMISNTLWPRWLGGVNRPYLSATRFPNLESLERILRLFEGGLRFPIDSIWDLKDALKGYEVAMSRRAREKIIVKM